MKRSITMALVLLFPLSSLAWEHTTWVWVPEDQPVEFTISDYVEDSIPEGTTEATILAGYENWKIAECADFESDHLGLTDENTTNMYNFENHVSFDDPGNKIAGGTLAVTYTIPGSEVAFVQDGKAYFRALDSDIVFNDNVDFILDADIEAGLCSGETSMESVGTHEIGHLMGLGHSCEEGDPCTDQDLLEATMFWTAGPCDMAQSVPNADEVQGLQALYGPYSTFRCSHEINPDADDPLAFGVVPFDLRCVVDSKNLDEVTGATWYFGDGGTSTELDPVHTYDEPGNYTVQVCFDGESPTCGDWEFCYRKVGYVRACGVPDVVFTTEHLDGLTYKLRNETDISVYGCIFEVQWDVYNESGDLMESIKAWEPDFTFEEAGNYRIVLNVGGPAGTGAAELTLAAKNQRGAGYGSCSNLGPMSPMGGLVLLLAGALVFVRRRLPGLSRGI